ncbi:MAG TPA: sulfotransferase domain-containing protein [Candidatus Sulfotelmatobacter sp.]|nr:sulfotransferase domain-containing protein [Candidatus Sulfotelmatobacter sp.]
MLYGIRVVLTYLLGTDKAERNFAVFPDDTFVVSYPRSGNTWTRFLIANLAYPEETVTFANIERLVPDTSSQSNRALKRTPRPRIIKTHQYFDHRYGKMIYVVRDPRDVALSLYHFQRKYRQIPDDYPLEASVNDFVRGNLISIDWGTWGENVASWIYTRGGGKDFLLLRYEDMVSDTPRELSRVARHLGIAATPERLNNVVERCSADRMRELEKLQQNDWVATAKHRKDIPFVGFAQAGGWRKRLPESCVAQIENAWGELMTRLGYDLVSMSSSHRQTTSQEEVARRT